MDGEEQDRDGERMADARDERRDGQPEPGHGEASPAGSGEAGAESGAGAPPDEPEKTPEQDPKASDGGASKGPPPGAESGSVTLRGGAGALSQPITVTGDRVVAFCRIEASRHARVWMGLQVSLDGCSWREVAAAAMAAGTHSLGALLSPAAWVRVHLRMEAGPDEWAQVNYVVRFDDKGPRG